MGKLILRFIGLAVHFDQNDAPRLPVHHRVVFLANPGLEVLFERAIQPHQPRLHFPNGPRLELSHVVMSVENPAGSRFQKDETFLKVPRLTSNGPRLPLKTEVVYEKQPPAMAYFDTDHGLLSACTTPRGAIGTRLEIETDGPPTLVLTSFDGKHRMPFQFERDEAVLSITNVANDEKDDEFDFLLSYRVLATLPVAPFIPAKPERDLPECDPGPGGDLGPACSNSSYP